MTTWLHRSALLVLAAFATAACGADAADSDAKTRLGETASPLSLEKVQPLAKVNVKTAGEIDVETDYLPQVVCCENGAAPPEALKAQAVMARSYMTFRYYDEGTGTAAKPFTGTTSDQAYFCAQKVSAACRDAVNATKGQITSYTNAAGLKFANVAFFIDGPKPACIAQKSCACAVPSTTTSMSPADHPAGCACFTDSSQGAANPAYVTYNWSHSGTAVVGSTIGDPKNESNRGCASQNIQACLAYAGWAYLDMLRLFYGQDIELAMMDGTAVTPTQSAPPASDGDGGTVVTPLMSSANSDDSGCSVARMRSRKRNSAMILIGLALMGYVLRRRRGRLAT